MSQQFQVYAFQVYTQMYILRRNKKISPHKNLSTCFHNSIIHESREVGKQPKEPLMDERVKTVAHTYTKNIIQPKEQENSDVT